MKKNTLIIVLFIVIGFIIIFVSGFFMYKRNLNNSLPPFKNPCTDEAKLCADGSAVGRVGPNCEFAPCPKINSLLSESEAFVIAQDFCIKEGESLSSGYYNENSKTWWFDADLKDKKTGCSPACVVSAETKTAEINWRCTGLILPESLNIEKITKLFVQKYPKYTETISIKIEQETENYMRGSVSFVADEAGGYFFAKRINGEWQLVLDGNGQISCTLLDQGFPDEMLTDCTK